MSVFVLVSATTIYVARAEAQGGPGGASPSNEVLVGTYTCSSVFYNPSNTVTSSVYFNATGDLLNVDQYGRGLSTYNAFNGGTATADDCQSLLSTVQGALQAAGCTQGNPQTQFYGNPGASTSFGFVCAGVRSALIETIGQLSLLVLTEAPVIAAASLSLSESNVELPYEVKLDQNVPTIVDRDGIPLIPLANATPPTLTGLMTSQP